MKTKLPFQIRSNFYGICTKSSRQVFNLGRQSVRAEITTGYDDFKILLECRPYDC